MTAEFQRGVQFMKQHLGRMDEEAWKNLIEPANFFHMYRKFLRVEITAENEDDHRAWYSPSHPQQEV
jgi:poly(A) polymerase